MTPFGPWLPDQPAYRDQPSLTEALNCLPRADGSYGPLPQMDSIAAALPARALAMASTRSTDGQFSTFVGTASHLYQMASAGSWTQVSKTGGYSLDIDAFERQEFAQFGDQLLAVMGIGDPTQIFTLGSSSQFSDVTGPRARHISVVRDHVMVGNTWDSVQGERQDQVWWSAIGDPTTWPTIGSDTAVSVQSDRQVLPDAGAIQKIVPGVGAHDAVIFGETRITTTDYVGSPLVFRFDPVEGARGCFTPGSVVRYGAGAFYLSREGLQFFNGAESVSIGRGKFDEWLLSDLDETYRDWMSGAFDYERNLLLYIYPGAGNLGGLPNHLIAYEPKTGYATRGRLEVDLLASVFTAGYTLEGLDSLGYTLETLPFSLDSRVWKGGSPFLGSIRTSDRKLAAFGATNMQADLATQDLSGPMGSRIWFDGLRIYTDADDVQGSIAWKDGVAGSTTTESYVTQDEDFIDHLVACRYGRVLARVPEGSTWTSIHGYDARFRQEGLR